MRAAAVLLALVACSSGPGDVQPDAAPPLPPVDDPLPYTDPLIGSGGFGFANGSAFPGAAAPNGLAKVGPDTEGEFGTVNFLHYSGYWYGDDTIRGFSHLHLHGTGATDYGVLAVMPVLAFDPTRTTVEAYKEGFDKADEVATPGFYGVRLDSGIDVEIVATVHGAHHRFTGAGALIVDLAHLLDGGVNDSAELTIDPAAQTLRGRLHHLGGMSGGFGGYDVYFEARLNVSFTAQVWSDGNPPATGTTASGTGVGAALVFPAGSTPELIIGLSLVDEAGAAANLAAELPAFDFAATRAATQAAWSAILETFRVEGGTAVERRIFYSSMYKAFLMPTVTSDVDGRYRYAGGAPRQATGFRFLSDMSLWDTYRTLHPLYAWLAPALALESVKSLHAMATASGFFPRWPIATGEAGTMIGASADVVIADAYVKGVSDFDAAAVYSLLRAAALDATPPPGGRGGRDDFDHYLTTGWVPATGGRAVSKTTEYAADDFALAQLAAALGQTADADALLARAVGYRELYDPAVGFLHGRFEDGSFESVTNFDPLEFSDDYAEANAWQSLWMAMHDIDGLVALLGGEAAFVTRLSELFDEAAADLARNPVDSIPANAQPRPYYWHGNEPDIQAAYFFGQVGRPDLTARWVRWIMTSLYSDQGNGLPGNDDGGTMSAWYVWSALGLYPLAGSDRYFLGTPLFPRVEVKVAGGVFTVEAENVSATNLYVQSVTLDGVPVVGQQLRHAELRAGSTLRFVMGPAAL